MIFKDTEPSLTLEWCVVVVPDYCPSGYRIAKWNGSKWLDDELNDITKYVIEWAII